MPKGKRPKNVGFGITPPSETCDDPKCPFHGDVRVRGLFLKGVVVSDKMQRTVVVQREYLQYIPKYERYMRKRSRVFAHNPPCINAKEGDIVLIGETRPLARNVSFVVLQKLGRVKTPGKP
ncbi:30S ribosomal protein S17 [archaeon]|nr:30S ribosomal protein S17 [archaeon]